MPLYTFFLHDGPEHPPEFVIEHLEPDEAEARARMLLRRRPRYEEVVICHDEIEVGRITRR